MRRRFAIALCAIFLSANLSAQVANYSFGQSNGTYTPITGGTVLGTVTSDDQRFLDPAFPEGTTSIYTGPGFPIGFTFYFNGIAFDRIAINNNGWISFGQSSLTPSVDLNSTSSFAPLASVASNTPDYLRSRVSAFGRDIQAQAGAELRIETIGTSPNQVCVIQWTNYKRYSSNGTGDTINFQIRLSEAGGVETDQTIELVYGKVVFGSSSTTNYVAQVGIGGTLSTDAHNRVTSLPHDWNASSQGLLNTDGCQLPYTGVSVVAPASGLTFSYNPPLPCTGTPTPGNTLTTSDFLCPGAPFTLSLQYTNFGSMITYQWQTSADGILWNDIAGAIQAVLVYSQSSASYYRCAVTCTNSNETGYSNPVYIGLVGLPGLPYQEDLESILLNNEYPNCMNSTNLGLYTFTYTADQGSYNRYAHSGSKFASFKYGCSDYFFTPAVELAAGNTYQFSFFYITDGYSGWDTLEARFGSAPDAASMTNTIVTISNPSNTSYLKLEGTFIPPSSGIYYIGIYCNASFAPWYLSIDDLSLVEYSQCMGTPDGGTAVSNQSAVCGGVSFILSLTGQTIASGLTYQWQSSADGNSWSDMPGANQSSLTQSQNSDTYYRCSITCTNSNLTGYSDPVFVEAVGIPALPYTEDFESISATNEYPNCMSSTSLGTYTFTYTADQGSYNRYAHGGEKFASFKYGCDDYFFTPGFELVAGNTYQFSFYYITDGYSGWNTLEAKYGTAPDPASMTMTIASVANPVNTEYEKLIGTFTPAISGTYFIGLYCNSTFVPWYLSFDDLSLVEFPPCAGTPEAGVTQTDQSEVCSGVPLVLQLSGQSIASGLDYQWQRSADGNNWNDIAGATSETSTVSQTEDTYYRCKVTCSLSGQSDFSSMILVTTSANLVPPYLEGFESIAQENEYPNCMSSTNLGTGTFTYTTAQGSNNQLAHGGAKFASFGAPGNDFFFTPGIELAGGQTYQFSFYYITDGLAGWNQLSAHYGTSPDSLSMTNLIASIYNVSGISYQKFSGAFTPPTSDVFFIGINCVSAASANFLTIDDLSLTESDCYAPANVAVSYISATAAQLDWDCNGCSGDYYVEYGLAPTYFGWVGNIGVNAGSSPYILSNLLPDEDYTVYLQQNCSSGGSPVVQVDFHTQVFTGTGVLPALGNSILVFPNPANGAFQIHATLGGGGDETATILINDLLGRTIQSLTARFREGLLHETLLPGENLTDGTYVVRIVSQHGNLNSSIILSR